MTHEPGVWLAQLLCSTTGRHCIFAIAFPVPEHDPDVAAIALQAMILDMLKKRELNSTCQICGATDETWVLDVGKSIYATMEEAAPALARLEAEQAKTAAFFKAAKN